jgi:hypothetical protein
MNRRDFLKFSLGTASAAYFDWERLLWVTNQTIVVPSSFKRISELDIIIAELDRIAPRLKHLFDRDEVFYSHLMNHIFSNDKP